MLGLITIVLCALGAVLLLVALWKRDESTWRLFGTVALTAVVALHTSLVVGGLRASDGPLVRALCQASIALGALGSTIGIAAVSGAIEEVDDGVARVVGALVALVLLTTLLPPLLRRLGASRS